MSDPLAITRRSLLASSAALLVTPARAADPEPSDRGIGGTGAAPDETQTGRDRGIGGTGVIGTIRRFGSIYVNDLHITFPRTVAVLIDDREAPQRDLKLGHVVGVLAERRDRDFATRLISVASEVVGPVEAVYPDGLVVLGQRVTTRGARWRVGDVVAVSGLRRLDGTIVASLVERRRGGPMRVAGPVTPGDDGVMMIGSLPVAGLKRSLAGRRVGVVGSLEGGVFRIDQADRSMSRLMALGPSQLSIEGYIAQGPDGVRIGSGLAVEGAAPTVPTSGEVKAIVTAAVEPDGGLRLETVRFEGGRQGSSNTYGGPGPAGPGPGFGPGPGPGFGGPPEGAGNGGRNLGLGGPNGTGLSPGSAGAQTTTAGPASTSPASVGAGRGQGGGGRSRGGR